MRSLYKYLALSHLRSKNVHSKPNTTTPFLCFFSSVPSLAPTHNSIPSSNPSLSNFLIETLAFAEPQAVSISKRFRPTETLEKPHSVVQYFKQLGFSDTHIRSSIRFRPSILFSDIDKTLKPKLQFFQDLGFTGPDMGKLISTRPRVLFLSLEGTLKPCVDIIKEKLVNDVNNQGLIRVLRRCFLFFPKSGWRMRCYICFLESRGIVGSHLSLLLERRPWLICMQEPALRDLVSRVLDMGFSVDSTMLVHAMESVSSITGETFSRKIDLFRTFGFSEDECLEMIRRAPRLLSVSKAKLKVGVEFFLNDVKLDRSKLVRRPTCLMFSMEGRTIPRHKVLQVLKCKTLLKKDPNLLTILHLTEEKFVEIFISRFRDDAEELLVAYKGNPLDYVQFGFLGGFWIWVFE